MYELLYKGKLPIKMFLVKKAATIPHLSHELKVFHVVEGDYIFHSNMEETPVSEGNVFVVGCGHIHSFHRVSETGNVKVMYINVDHFKDICKISHIDDLERDDEALKELFHSVEADDDLLILSKLSLVLRMVYSSITHQCDTRAIDIVSLVIEFMLTNYKEKIVIADIADMLKVNSKQLMRQFKSVTGYTMLKYLTIARLNASLIDLHLNKTIMEVALNNGFSDQKGYHKSFKEYFLMTPKEYRVNVFKM